MFSGTGFVLNQIMLLPREVNLTKNTSAETLKRLMSFSMCSVVNFRFPLKTSEAMLSVLKMSLRSRCFKVVGLK